MVQVYFLLVITNVLSGMLLARSAWKGTPHPDLDAFLTLFQKKWGTGALGLVTFVTGFLGLIFVLPGDQVFLGDLIPSLTALVAGTTLVLEFYKKDSPERLASTEKLDNILLANKLIIGFLALGFGILHFILPQVVFL